MSPAMHGRHIGVMTPAASSSSSLSSLSSSSYALSHFRLSIDNFPRVHQYRRVKHHNIQVKIDNGGHPHIWNELWSFLLRFLLNCGFRSITFEGTQQFHSHLTEGKSIIKYRSSLNFEVICKLLTELHMTLF